MKKQANKKRRIIITLVVIAVVIVIDLTFTGFLKFGYSTLKCGRLPVKVDPGGFAAGSPTYALPGHYVPGGAVNNYLCSEREALDLRIPKDLYN